MAWAAQPLFWPGRLAQAREGAVVAVAVAVAVVVVVVVVPRPVQLPRRPWLAALQRGAERARVRVPAGVLCALWPEAPVGAGDRSSPLLTGAVWAWPSQLPPGAAMWIERQEAGKQTQKPHGRTAMHSPPMKKSKEWLSRHATV